VIYIFESNVPQNRSLLTGLGSIFGLNRKTAQFVCKKMGLSSNIKVKDLSKQQLDIIFFAIKSLNLTLGVNLKRFRDFRYKESVSIKSYKGLRRYKNLPIRGQRTHTNARTCRRVK